jgi:hypothetical protein
MYPHYIVKDKYDDDDSKPRYHVVNCINDHCVSKHFSEDVARQVADELNGRFYEYSH